MGLNDLTERIIGAAIDVQVAARTPPALVARARARAFALARARARRPPAPLKSGIRRLVNKLPE